MEVLSIVTLATIIYANAAVTFSHLDTGRDMPVIGLGTWQAKGDPVFQAVKDELENGYRHIDTAYIYGNEKEVGVGLHAEIAADIVKREDVFITTKVWPDGSNQAKALAEIKHSLEKITCLEDAYEQKLVRSIGISNFVLSQIDNLMKTAKVKPAVKQINLHPSLNQDETVAHYAILNISVTGYSPSGNGRLVDNSLFSFDKVQYFSVKNTQ